MLASSPSAAVRLVSVRLRGVERTLALLGPEPRLEYVRLVAHAAPAIEVALGDEVVANRVGTCSVDPPTLTLRPWRVERRLFAAALAETSSSHRTLAFADVAACYASIGPEVVHAALERLDAPGAAAVQGFLTSLARHGVRGLPVGPNASAVLANAVLSHVDRALRAARIAHIRWVDDIVIGVRGPSEATHGLELVRDALHALGLRPNERKTRVVTDPASLVSAGTSGMRGRPVRVG